MSGIAIRARLVASIAAAWCAVATGVAAQTVVARHQTPGGLSFRF